MIHDVEEKTKEEILKRKFFVAGCSERWFFSYKYLGVVKAIDWCVSKISDVSMYTQSRMGYRGEQAHHRLFALFKGNENPQNEQPRQFFVSPYATRTLLLKDEYNVIDILVKFSGVQENPAFHGWIVEFEFIAYLRAASKFDTYVRVRNEE